MPQNLKDHIMEQEDKDQVTNLIIINFDVTKKYARNFVPPKKHFKLKYMYLIGNGK